MNRVLIFLLCLVSLTLANSFKTPSKCVSKGDAVKCVGYEHATGMIFNKKEKHAHVYNQDGAQELYAEFKCKSIQPDANNETLRCNERTLLFEARCDAGRGTVEFSEYDELGILVDKKIVRENLDICRKKFHQQFGKESVEVSHEGDEDVVIEKGSRPAADIMNTIHKNTPHLQRIYKKHLRRMPGFGGKIVLRLTVEPGGEIVKISVVSSTTGNAQFDDDIKFAVYRWQFGKYDVNTTTMTVPITFGE